MSGLPSDAPCMSDAALARHASLCERPERWTVSRFAEALAAVIAECRRVRAAEDAAAESAARTRAGYELVVQSLEARMVQAETEAAGLRAALMRAPVLGGGAESD